jgi:hypothetical protein
MVGITQPDGLTTETGASQESCEKSPWLGEFKMKVLFHESPARVTKLLSTKENLSLFLINKHIRQTVNESR